MQTILANVALVLFLAMTLPVLVSSFGLVSFDLPGYYRDFDPSQRSGMIMFLYRAAALVSLTSWLLRWRRLRRRR